MFVGAVWWKRLKVKNKEKVSRRNDLETSLVITVLVFKGTVHPKTNNEYLPVMLFIRLDCYGVILDTTGCSRHRGM